MGYFMKLFLDLSVLALRPEGDNGQPEFFRLYEASKEKFILTLHHLDEDWSC